MTAMVQEFDGVRELSVEKVDAVSGAFGLVGGGIGFAISFAREAFDNEPGIDWGSVAIDSTTGAVGGGVYNGLRAVGAGVRFAAYQGAQKGAITAAVGQGATGS